MNTYTIEEVQNTIIYTLFFCTFIIVFFYYIYKILHSILKFIINLIFEKTVYIDSQVFTDDERKMLMILLNQEAFTLNYRLSPEYFPDKTEANLKPYESDELREIRKKRYDIILGMIRKAESTEKALIFKKFKGW